MIITKKPRKTTGEWKTSPNYLLFQYVKSIRLRLIAFKTYFYFFYKGSERPQKTAKQNLCHNLFSFFSDVKGPSLLLGPIFFNTLKKCEITDNRIYGMMNDNIFFLPKNRIWALYIRCLNSIVHGLSRYFGIRVYIHTKYTSKFSL